MRFEVPQFVDIEDRIFGPFTWKQFVYMAGGAGAGFMLFITLPFFIFILVGGPIIALSLGLAFYQINNRPLSAMLEAIVLYFTHGRLYLWKKDVVKKEKVSEDPIQHYTSLGHNNINSLARSLEMKALQRDMK